MSGLPCPPELYPALSRLLDRALDLPPEDRGAWVDALGDEDAAVVPYLRRVLGGGSGRGCSEGPLDRRPLADWDPPVSSPGAEPGRPIGPYTLERMLGWGGMGEVWLASRSDGAYERRVALKLPHLHLAGSIVGRFFRERDILAALTHPHIAQFLDAGVTAAGQPYLALEWVSGQPITDACRAASTSLAGRLALIEQVTSAVQHAHTRLVVHRDIKPTNVLVDLAGQVKLLDFGIAKLLESPDSDPDATQLTRLGVRPGTPDYAAPEQLAGGPITVGTDVYSLGILLFELLTGRRPFASVTADRSTRELRSDPPLASALVVAEHASSVGGMTARSLARALSGDLDAILAKALAYTPAERYETVDAFAADLGRWREFQPIRARRLGRLARAGRFARRHRLGVGLGAALALAVGLGVAGVLWQAAQTAAEARRANATRDFLVGIFKGSDPRIARNRPRGEITARELLDLATPRLERELADDPATRDELLGLTATIYTYLDELVPARRLGRLYTTALAARLPSGSPKVIDALLFEVWTALQAGDHAAAAARLGELDARLHAADLDVSRQRAEWLLARGDLAAANGDLAVQEELLIQAVALYQQVAPHDSGHAATLANLGGLAFARDDLDGALGWLDRALFAAEHADQEEGIDLARIQSRRGRVLTELGRDADAETAFVDARRRFAGTIGAEHSTAWQATAGLAYLRCRRGDRTTADALFASLPAPTAGEVPGSRRRRAEAELLQGRCLAISDRPGAADLLARSSDLLRDQPDAAGDVRRAQRELARLAPVSQGP